MADWVGTNTPAIIKNFQTLCIGIPKNTIRDGNISPGKAAEFAANAANKAGKDLSIKYYGTPVNIFNAIPASTIEAEFRTLMSNYLKNSLGASCSVTRNSAGTSTTVNPPVWNTFYDQINNIWHNKGCDN